MFLALKGNFYLGCECSVMCYWETDVLYWNIKMYIYTHICISITYTHKQTDAVLSGIIHCQFLLHIYCKLKWDVSPRFLCFSWSCHTLVLRWGWNSEETYKNDSLGFDLHHSPHGWQSFVNIFRNKKFG